ncbi:hypothetical protein, partial [Ensifer sp. MJa1]|uniref:hypothetical protein n=1 Tax=Ensifer sp. MJa1 TaxID=2919888 RepID=UPI00300BE186
MTAKPDKAREKGLSAGSIGSRKTLSKQRPACPGCGHVEAKRSVPSGSGSGASSRTSSAGQPQLFPISQFIRNYYCNLSAQSAELYLFSPNKFTTDRRRQGTDPDLPNQLKEERAMSKLEVLTPANSQLIFIDQQP